MAKDKVKPKSTHKKDETESAGIWKDERFQHLVTDPRFKSLPKQQRKVKIDKRFQGMFTNEKFNVKYTVDKYGRKINKSNAEDLRKYYELNSSDEEQEEAEKSGEDDEEEIAKEEKAIVRENEGEDKNDELASDAEDIPKTLRERLVDPEIDYARGEGRLVTDSSSDEESTDEEESEMFVDHVWGELANDADTTDESTKRLAVCNMDWDRIRAVDIMVLLASFLPPGGTILSVKIYPSEFGKERMKEEELHGPPELVGLGKEDKELQNKKSKSNKNEADSSDSESDDELVQEQDSDAGEGDDYHMEKLRQYQLNRLRYYYAVVECDSVTTADKIYAECDGIEYESSATRVDLRFIPDDTTFDEDEPSDVCSELPDSSTYIPRQFTTTALQQAKVDLTWDETAMERKELGDKLSSGKLEGISDKDLRTIVAYSSEEEELDDEKQESDKTTQKQNEKISDKPKIAKKAKKKDEIINKYKALLVEINEKEEKEKKKKKYEMEFTWNVNENKDEDSNSDEKEESAKSEMTPIERVLQKRSEKNKKRKVERKKKKLESQGIDVDNLNSGSDEDSMPDGIDMADPYFAEEFANGDFIDPQLKLKEKQKKQKLLKAEINEKEEEKAKELQLLLDDDNDEDQGKKHFSLEKILKAEQETKSKKKRRKQLKKSKHEIENSKKEEDNFKMNVNDDRFNAVFTSHEFNIDPTDPHFKKTKAMDDLIHEKLKRRHSHSEPKLNQNSTDDSAPKKPKKQIENTLLVKSLKRKIQLKQEQVSKNVT